MRRLPIVRSLLVLSSGWLLALACGSRTGLPPGRVHDDGVGGDQGIPDAGPDAPPDAPECVIAADCPQPPPNQCGTAACFEGVCLLEIGVICDDGDPCTVDACQGQACTFTSARVDADGDGVFARGTASDPNAALGCGNDCNDANAKIFPGAVELCDGLDNDCNGVQDDGTGLVPSGIAPVRVSPVDAELADATGLAFDGQGFGASMSVKIGTWQGHFRQLDAQGGLLGDSQRIAHVNAESYGGPLSWSGERYLTAYGDARQAGNYEIYFDLLNRTGQRLTQDLRITEAEDFSLRPAMAWTGAEGLLVWDDRRFEGAMDGSVLMGQRVSIDGALIGGNILLTPAGVAGEGASITLSDTGLGIAFVSTEGLDETRVRFMTTSRTLEQPSAVTTIDFSNAVAPAVAALGDKYVVTFHQESASIGPAIYGVVIGSKGVELGPFSLTAGGTHARGNATYSYGNRFVMVWADDKDGVYQLYEQVFDAKLAPISKRQRVTMTGTKALGPVIAPAANGGLGILYTDESTSRRQVYFTMLNCQAVP